MKQGAVRGAVALWFALTGTSAVAQDFTVDAHLIDRCLGINQDTPMACVGRQADVCYDAHGGGADMVLAACQSAELAFWDGALNAVYQELLTHAARLQDDDIGYGPNQLTDAARAMQRTWIVYRDATCGLDLARAAPFGSAAGPAESGCLMRETARQYFQLQHIVGGYRS